MRGFTPLEVGRLKASADALLAHRTSNGVKKIALSPEREWARNICDFCGLLWSFQ